MIRHDTMRDTRAGLKPPRYRCNAHARGLFKVRQRNIPTGYCAQLIGMLSMTLYQSQIGCPLGES